LDVGVRHYTEKYKEMLGDCVTIDNDPIRNSDIVADVTSANFTSKKFGSILFNGVIHFGINTKLKLRAAMLNFFNILEQDGVLVIGWNEWRITRDDISNIAINVGFQRELVLGRDVYEPVESPEKHYYSIWRKP
jgi:hypothetical protein